MSGVLGRIRHHGSRLATAARRRRAVRQLRALQDAFLEEQGAFAHSERFAARHGTVVARGPCAGLEYPPGVARRTHHLVPKLLGSYEAELHPALERALTARPAAFVDVGCAEGYYAAGLARRLPGAPVHAFDADPVARRLSRELARHNGVEVRLHGFATARRLARMPLDGAFVLCDCEGFEVEVLAEPALARLATATLLVELHVRDEGPTGPVVAERLAGSHEMTPIEPAGRDAGDYPELADQAEDERALALNEFRPVETRWALFSPR
jgi:hypothetical protein